MPTLKREKSPTVATYLNLPVETRDQLVAAIDGVKIRTLTDAVVAAAKALAAAGARKRARLAPKQPAR